jgi:hypothetical protein
MQWRRPSRTVASVSTCPNRMSSCTIVCATAGRMPVMMHCAPSSRAAPAICSSESAVDVSIVSTPVTSIRAKRDRVRVISCSSRSIIMRARSPDSAPTTGSDSTPSHTSMIGVDSRSISASRSFASCSATRRFSFSRRSCSSATARSARVALSEPSSCPRRSSTVSGDSRISNSSHSSPPA